MWRSWRKGLESKPKVIILTPFPHSIIHIMNAVHRVEEVKFGIDSTIEYSIVVALEGRMVEIITMPMHISRKVAQTINVVIPVVTIGLAPAH